MSGRRNPPPTGVLRAIQEGAKLGPRSRILTPSGGVPAILDADTEPSTPVGMTQVDRIEWRQQQHASDVQELGRALGALQTTTESGFIALGRDIGTLARLAEKDDVRKDRAEERAATLAEKREEREATTIVAKRSSREKITLAVIAAAVSIASAVGGYFVAHSDDVPTARHRPSGSAAP